MADSQVLPGSEPINSDREVDDPTAPCPLKECGIVVWCSEVSGKPIGGVDAAVSGNGSKDTSNEDGTAEFKGIKPPNQEYTVTVTLKGDNKLNYIWDDNDGSDATPDRQKKNVAGGSVELFVFDAIRLARPKIKLNWAVDGKAVAKVGVKVKGDEAASGEKTFSDTDDSGIATLPSAQPGLRPDGYTVTFPKGLEHCEIVDHDDNSPKIDVEEASTDTFAYKVRKFYVNFQVKDQFGDPVPVAGYLLTYPPGKDPESGNLTEEAKGLVSKEQVPKGDYKFAVKVLYDLNWGPASEDPSGPKKVEIGKAGKLSAKVSGFPKDTPITFTVFDAVDHFGTALDTVNGTTGDSTAEVDWTPDADKLKTVTSGAVVFVAKIDTVQHMSAPAVVEAKQTYTITGPDSQPLTTRVVLKFTGGLEIAKSSEGGKVEAMVPLGRSLLSIALPDQPGVQANFTPDSGSARGFVVPKVD